MELKDKIRDVPGFPKEGVIFKDISTLLADPPAFRSVIDRFYERYRDRGIDVVLAVEARGFLFAAPLAYRLGAGLGMVRKRGKLPYKTIARSYALEYGSSTLEMHIDVVSAGQKVLIMDDLLATGGTAAATAQMVQDLGATVEELAFVIELDFLNGREALRDLPVFSIIHY